ncbi:hypothetical protein HZH68_007947 [Vespula germanica]|uniref:Uncharacterized protein n=2 Tax=Vespula TaxID=7451 RepID=A0A834K3U8_VESGE|nr:hypothetical protein HZH68_007947 [Vespula germanica]KAF7423348.1 hypothetical protein H0235_008631 [Vespula pensylvanica]
MTYCCSGRFDSNRPERKSNHYDLHLDTRHSGHFRGGDGTPISSATIGKPLEVFRKTERTLLISIKLAPSGRAAS